MTVPAWRQQAPAASLLAYVDDDAQESSFYAGERICAPPLRYCADDASIRVCACWSCRVPNRSSAKRSAKDCTKCFAQRARYFIRSKVFCSRSRSLAPLTFARLDSIHFFSSAFFVGRSDS